MAQVNVTINGRQFRMACEDGQEDHLRLLAKALEDRIGTLRGQFGEIGDAAFTSAAERIEGMAKKLNAGVASANEQSPG